MARWAVAGLLLLCLVFAHGKKAAEEHVVTINGEEEFNKAVKGSDMLVAEFYAPWCGHCKSLAPEYEKAAKALKDAGNTVVLAKVIIKPARPLSLCCCRLLPRGAQELCLLLPYIPDSIKTDASVQRYKH